MRNSEQTFGPITNAFERLKEHFTQQSTVILEAPPGTGKSTVLPLMLLESQLVAGKILLLQPRRIAARMVAQRLAEHLGEDVGQQIGYSVRFEAKRSAATKVEVITEGLLLRRLQSEPLLDSVDLVIFDEFHERSLEADFSLALLREVQQIMRPELRLLIMSATLAIGELQTAFPEVPVVKVDTAHYPLEIKYHTVPLPTTYQFQRCQDDAVMLTQQALQHSTGHILVFLPGQREISAVEDRLNALNSQQRYIVYPLYAELSQERQKNALAPSRERKIILATSIAETSLTIDSVDAVVDTGWVRRTRYNPKTGLTTLDTFLVTQDAATQRAGRAARQKAGVVFRAWTVNQQQLLEPAKPLAILASDLSGVVLHAAISGNLKFDSLPWVTKPSASLWAESQQLLKLLGLLTADGRVTGAGKQAATYPCHARLGAMLTKADATGWLRYMPELVVLAEERLAGSQQSVDIWYLLDGLLGNAGNRAVKSQSDLVSKWHQLLKTKPVQPADYPHEIISKALSWAYPDRVAKRLDGLKGQYKLANGQTVRINDDDPITGSEWLVIVESDGNGRVTKATTTKPEDLIHLVEISQLKTWDETRNRVVKSEIQRIGQIQLSAKNNYSVTDAEALPVLLEQVSKHRWHMLNQPDELENWLARLSSIAVWAPELGLPNISQESVFEPDSLKKWLEPQLAGKRSRDELNRLDVMPFIVQLIDYEQQMALDRLAPKTFKVPTGSQIKINYQPDGDVPVLSVRLQELFGQTVTPTIMNGQIKLKLELLSPGYKPVQTTQDLVSFWANAYHEVKKELKRRYPKHSWPDNPLEAEPVRGVKKRT